MGLERRGRADQGQSEANPPGEEPREGPRPKVKSFEIGKRLIVEAWEKVRANKGAPGVDAVSIGLFEEQLRDNLYKLWNRMSSGSYFPGPVRGVEIPKDHGEGVRLLGVPNTADRVAQTAAAMLLEEKLEPIFHPDSYGYRPGRTAHDALAVCRQRCWKQDWVLDIDIRAFFDSVPHSLLLKAVAHHTSERWVLLYISRWLVAPMQMPDGTIVAREKGTPQGSPISPILANLFMHYAFDRGWTGSSRAARSSATRTTSLPTATPRNRPGSCGPPSLSGSGPWASSCTPRRRRSCTAKTRTAEETSSTPASTSSATPSGAALPVAREAISLASPRPSAAKAKKAKGQQIRAWHLNRRSGTDLSGLAEAINPQVRGWINYYGAFYRSELRFLAWRINEHLARWAMHKFKRFRGKYAKAMAWLQKVYQHQPRLFAHWQLVAFT